MRLYRAKLREQKKIIETPPERKSDPVKSLNDIKKEVVNKVSEVVVDVFQHSIKR